MPPKYYQPSSNASRRLTAMSVLAFLAIGVILFALVDRHQTDVADEPRPLPPSTTSSVTPLTGRGEICPVQHRCGEPAPLRSEIGLARAKTTRRRGVR